DAVAGLLGGPHRYLVFAANNSEMRAGSGMFLSVGVMTTSNGTIELSDMEPTGDLPVPPGKVPISGDLAARWGWIKPTEDFRNLMVSPRFDLMAPLAAQMWQAVGRPPVDGVLALDPIMLRAMLAATGPVDVNGLHID